MDDDYGGWIDADGTRTPALRPLDTYPVQPATRTRLVPATLVLAAVTVGVAMPLPWHHLHVAGAPDRVVNGVYAASWLFVVVALLLVLALRTWLRAPGVPMKWAVSVLAFFFALGTWSDYYDWGARALALNTDPYYGPGFLIAVAGAGLGVLAAVLALRVRD